MRILQIDKFLRRSGGAATYMLDLSDLLRREGHQVEFFSMANPDNIEATHEDDFVPHVPTDPAPEGLSAKVAAGLTMIHSRTAAQSIERVLDAFAPDVVHCHNIYHQLSPSILRPMADRGIPVVMTAHDFKLVCPAYRLFDGNDICTSCVGGSPLNAIRRRCKDDSLAASTLLAVETSVHRRTKAYDPIGAFIAPSEFLAGHLRVGSGYADRVRQIPNFVDCSLFEPRSHAGEGFAFVGRLSREKGVDLLIEAIGLTPSATLTIAGSGPLEAELRDQAAAVAPGRITFAGHLDKPGVIGLLAGARASVLPARYFENMPMSILETMAAGVPTIASDLGGIPELVVHNETGLLVAPSSVGELTDALAKLDADPELAMSMGKAARAAAETEFDAPQHLRNILTTYRQVGARV